MIEREIELAARKLCELYGRDPDEPIDKPVVDHTVLFGVRFEPTPYWKDVAKDIIRFDRTRQAIAWAKEQT